MSSISNETHVDGGAGGGGAEGRRRRRFVAAPHLRLPLGAQGADGHRLGVGVGVGVAGGGQAVLAAQRRGGQRRRRRRRRYRRRRQAVDALQRNRRPRRRRTTPLVGAVGVGTPASEPAQQTRKTAAAAGAGAADVAARTGVEFLFEKEANIRIIPIQFA